MEKTDLLVACMGVRARVATTSIPPPCIRTEGILPTKTLSHSVALALCNMALFADDHGDNEGDIGTWSKKPSEIGSDNSQEP